MPKDSSTTTWPGRAQHTCPRRSLLSNLDGCLACPGPSCGRPVTGDQPHSQEGVHSEDGDSPVRM